MEIKQSRWLRDYEIETASGSTARVGPDHRVTPRRIPLPLGQELMAELVNRSAMDANDRRHFFSKRISERFHQQSVDPGAIGGGEAEILGRLELDFREQLRIHGRREERMSAAGFLTAAFVRNPALRQYTHIDRGFDEYHFQREPHPPSALAEVLLRPLLPETYLPQVGAEVQTRRVSEWISAHKDRDFFLWVHYFDPHMSYNPPREFQPEGTPPPEIGRNFEDAARVRGGFLNPDAAEREWIRKLYAGEVRATDRGIAGLFKSLESNGIFDNSLIVFTADHGDELWEHDGFEHGHVMYDEVLGVPLFMKLPAGALVQRVDEAVSNQSIAATVLEVAGVPYLQEEFSAPPLVRRSAGEATLSLAVHPRALVSSGILYFEARTAVVFEGFKYIQFHVSKREELYDLAADPGEKHNLLAERPEFADRGRALLRAELDKATAMRLHLGIDSAQSGQLDKDNARAMRALGYVK